MFSHFTLTAGQVGTGRWVAGHEWIAGESFGALADSDVIANGTFRIDTARRRAWIDTAVVVADLVGGALVVFCSSQFLNFRYCHSTKGFETYRHTLSDDIQCKGHPHNQHGKRKQPGSFEVGSWHLIRS